MSSRASGSGSSRSAKHPSDKSSCSEKHSSGLPLARIEEKDAEISVWIDLENCHVPHKNIASLSCRIVNALRELGYCSTDLTITAYGDTNSMLQPYAKALQQSGITLSHIEHIGKDAADHKMLEDFGTWAQKNEPPVNLLIVSGDTGFWPTMKTLMRYKYNIMMACLRSRFRNRPPANTVICWHQLMQGNLYPAQIEFF